jgi:NAD(P)-dependent dehydrogenase (short-subunit alcohol dehydrogenase family)
LLRPGEAADGAREAAGSVEVDVAAALAWRDFVIGKPFTDYTLDDYAAITAVNLAGFFHMTQRVIPHMVEQGGGHVVNVSTSLVDQPDQTRPAALAALTKGGLAAVPRSLAVEYAARQVRFNAVSLGVIKTEAHDPRSYDGLSDLHPLHRIGTVGDVVDGILYLERATFVTGEVLHIDGGGPPDTDRRRPSRPPPLTPTAGRRRHASVGISSRDRAWRKKSFADQP